MEVILFHETYDTEYSLDNFLQLLYCSQMKYFASDLLQEGFSATDIQEAVKRAMAIGQTSGLEIRQHFSLMYTQVNGQTIKDCKLSKLGYALVLMNARPDNIIVSNWQLKVLENFLK